MWTMKIQGERRRQFDSLDAAKQHLHDEWTPEYDLEDVTETNDTRRTFDIIVDGTDIGTLREA